MRWHSSFSQPAELFGFKLSNPATLLLLLFLFSLTVTGKTKHTDRPATNEFPYLTIPDSFSITVSRFLCAAPYFSINRLRFRSILSELLLLYLLTGYIEVILLLETRFIRFLSPCSVLRMMSKGRSQHSGICWSTCKIVMSTLNPDLNSSATPSE